MIASGAVLGFLGSWWGTAWIWAALAIFVAIGVVMNVYGGRTIDRIADTHDDTEMERLLPPGPPGGDRRMRIAGDLVPHALQADVSSKREDRNAEVSG